MVPICIVAQNFIASDCPVQYSRVVAPALSNVQKNHLQHRLHNLEELDGRRHLEVGPGESCLARRAHCLLAHLALVHVARGLVIVRVRRERGHYAQHCITACLCMAEAQAA